MPAGRLTWTRPPHAPQTLLFAGGQGDFDSPVLRLSYTSLTTPASVRVSRPASQQGRHMMGYCMHGRGPVPVHARQGLRARACMAGALCLCMSASMTEGLCLCVREGARTSAPGGTAGGGRKRFHQAASKRASKRGLQPAGQQLCLSACPAHLV